MRLIGQLGFLRVGTGAPEVEDERVLRLFRNRAELKKSYLGLQDELHRLKERIKQQEGATARVQEMLQGLEARLSHPETAFPALVFYQLRELWMSGHTLLKQFITGLATQQEERERRDFIARHNQHQFARRQAADSKVAEADARMAEARREQELLQHRIAALRRLWHYFKRRALRAQLQAASLRALLSMQELEAARAARTAIDAEPVPPFGGMSLEARRAINLAAIAYAQVLCERLTRTSLVELAREAAARREPPREDYGDHRQCEATIVEIQRGQKLLQQRERRAQQIKACAERLRGLARYRAAGDTVPTAESVGGAPGGSRALADDLWEIYRVLLR